MDSDYLNIDKRSYGKCYMSGLDGRPIELSKPVEFPTFDIGADWDISIVGDNIFDKFATYYLEEEKRQAAILLTSRVPESYIINKGATILFWKDGTKTIVKRSKDDMFDKRLGFLTAYFQRHCGLSKTKANKFLDNLEVQE